MTVHTLQVNGTRGEITPLMHARVDTDFYQSGYAVAQNMIVTRYGPLVRSPGTRHNGETKDHSKSCRMLPFEFSEEQVYALEIGDGYMRFWTPEGQVFDGATPYEIVTPYDYTKIGPLHGVQTGDAIYLFCKGYRPQVLKRFGETNWTLTPYDPIDGPYQDIKPDVSTTFTPSSRGALTPIMTSNTAPSGTASGSDGTANAYKAFDGDSSVGYVLSSILTGWVAYAPATPMVVDAYILMADDNAPQRTPSNWVIEGYNGTSWCR